MTLDSNPCTLENACSIRIPRLPLTELSGLWGPSACSLETDAVPREE